MAAKYIRKSKDEKLTWQQNLVQYIHDMVFLLAVVMLVFLLVFRIIVVSGSSMKQTLVDGDYLLLLSNTFYKEPQRGDIVVISKEAFENGTPIVKRVIATEGQTVDIDFTTGSVYVDGVELEEAYINERTYLDEGTVFPLTVDSGCIFVLGDNRGVSRDSRYPGIGQIDKREVLGKALFLFFPGTDYGQQERNFERIGEVA